MIPQVSRSQSEVTIWETNGTERERNGISYMRLYPSVMLFNITDDHVHDVMVGRKIPESIKDRIAKIFRERRYDSKAIFNDFRSRKVIHPGRNASSRSGCSQARASIVRLIKKTYEEEWKESVQYGKRWNVVIYFLGLKRTMGEVIKAVRSEYIVQEIALKVQYYKIMRDNPCVLNCATYLFVTYADTRNNIERVL
ncbi:TVG0575781 [Thermoplasma volcanium GSS1]|uniref:TVG0575781 protein n=1 Tax=Thermoplasma volcanium (strain ATCC 51530 / DSM 4299 / JCM 9571 / NBRC 15438 / GSS1) TaxID=273116 RepID=Q97B70_THEVO|nr:TVG0575781 [Thermoplasma volcanium GSS1]